MKLNKTYSKHKWGRTNLNKVIVTHLIHAVIGNLTLQWEWVMIQFVSDNIEQATEIMLFNSAEILLKLELYLKNNFQTRSNTNTNTNICIFEYKYKYVFGPSPAM